MPSIKSLLCSVVCFGVALPWTALAQQAAMAVDITSSPTGNAESVKTASVSRVTSTGPQRPRPPTARWLDLPTISFSQRYRNQYGDDGYHYFEDGQQRSLIAGRIKIDEEGKYAIGFRASSGRSFNWAYADYAGDGFSARLKNPQRDADYRN